MHYNRDKYDRQALHAQKRKRREFSSLFAGKLEKDGELTAPHMHVAQMHAFGRSYQLKKTNGILPFGVKGPNGQSVHATSDSCEFLGSALSSRGAGKTKLLDAVWETSPCQCSGAITATTRGKRKEKI